MGQFNIFVGYRYSGFDYLLNYNSWGVHTLGGVDPFNQAGYLLAGAFLSVADLYLEGCHRKKRLRISLNREL